MFQNKKKLGSLCHFFFFFFSFLGVGSAACTDQSFMLCLTNHGFTADLYMQNASLCLSCSSDAADSDKQRGNFSSVWTGKMS